jgi:hypothetical protein
MFCIDTLIHPEGHVLCARKAAKVDDRNDQESGNTAPEEDAAVTERRRFKKQMISKVTRSLQESDMAVVKIEIHVTGSGLITGNTRSGGVLYESTDGDVPMVDGDPLDFLDVHPDPVPEPVSDGDPTDPA